VLELVAALSVHDKQTRGHSERVRVFADLIATEMKLPPADRARLRWASLLHDIGKLVVPSEILSKPAKLNETERKNVERHPEEGARLIGPLRSWLGEWAAAVEHHHERWDGRGYPRALAGERISLAGRIVAVADSYEVMTAVRPYRRPIGVVAAREELVRCSGAQFDPAVVRAFLNISVGRLWRVVGLGSWIAQLPLLTWVNGLGLQWGSAIVSGSTALGLVAPGILPTPDAVPHARSTPPVAGKDASSHTAPTVGGPGSLAPARPTGGGARGSGPTHPGRPTSPAAPSGPTPTPSPVSSQPTPTSAPTPTPNPAPATINIPAGQTAVLGGYSAAGSFSDSDAAADTFTATVDYGDGSGVHALTLSGGSFTLSHSYGLTVLGTYTVTVTITDDDGASASATSAVTVIL
jgi:putative nucleotidyltransferase with HDIG domain